ncbi:MAG: hypothetical protein F4Z02_14560 [Acidimicrobiia bacterium]|nr:hypothetical protein [Acidimicrobiia bacterium]MYG72192.1 hypothetical protein [Acidimicrobiia bacterium]
MPDEGVRPDEQAAIDAIRGVEDVVGCQRLKPEGSVPTPDWRVTLADGRVADVEVTLAADGAELSFWAQMSEVEIDPETGMKRHKPKRWPDSRMRLEWHVWVSDHHPADNKKRPVKELVEALVNLLSSVEAGGGTGEEMLVAANDQLAPATLIMNRPGFLGRVTREIAQHPGGLAHDDFDAQIVEAVRRQGHWYPESFWNPETAREVRVVKPPESVGTPSGAIVTHASTGDSSFGWLDPLLPTLRNCVDRKVAKDQMGNAPGKKWLTVMLEGSAGWQLADLLDAGSQAPPLSELDDFEFGCFDEVWAIAKHPHIKSYVVLRLPGPEEGWHLVAVPRV